MQTGKILHHLIFRYNNLFELYTGILSLKVGILFATDACELAMLRAQNNDLSL